MLPPRIDVKAVQESIGPYADKKVSAEERGKIYKELIGFLPPRIEARINVTGALDPEMLDIQERMREHGMYPNYASTRSELRRIDGKNRGTSATV